MNASEVIRTISAEHGLTKTKATEILDSVANIVAHGLNNGGSVALPGIGKIEASRTKARTGRNPRTGESVQIPAKTKARFKPSKILLDRING